MGTFAAMLKPIVDLALPSRCPVCGVVVEDDHRFCPDCWQSLDFISEPWCNSCGIPFAFERPEGTVCLSCLNNPPEHDGVRAAVAYDNNSAKIAMGLKYSARLGFAELIAQHLTRYAIDTPENALIVPVPLHRWRMWGRGFNQSQFIADSLSKKTDLSVVSNVIFRSRATPPLRSMTAKQRAKTVGKAFVLGRDAMAKVKGRTVILVDDVYTTGVTANACSRLLREAGAHKIYVFCWARVISDGDPV